MDAPDGFLDAGVKTLTTALRQGQITPGEIAELGIRQVERHEPHCLAWECYDADHLRGVATNSERELAGGRPIRPLECMPVGIKDIFNTIEFPTQMGSPIWKQFTPGNDARAVYNLKEAGAWIPGKTVTAEFAVHALGKTLHPHDQTRNPGTSSSGSAVAVATGMVPVALGTQTAGSIVRPASYCGILGFKPSFGLIPRTGILKTTDSLDTIGFFVAHAQDLGIVFDALRVHGPDYPISHAILQDARRQQKPATRPWKIALVKPHVWSLAADYARNALQRWCDHLAGIAGVEVEERPLPPPMATTHQVHATIYNRTLSYYFKEESQRDELVSPIMQELIRDGQTITNQSFYQALRDQEQLCALMDAWFQDSDILVTLSTAGEAPPRDDPEPMDSALMWTLTHLPVISVPLFTGPSGLPFGAQFVCRRYHDYLLLQWMATLIEANLIPETSKVKRF
ncbi:MAG: amidase [Magnetococcales bacterium]|nr:amidase [Magnetococcales bacterium]